jgi:hypothetical protein
MGGAIDGTTAMTWATAAMKAWVTASLIFQILLPAYAKLTEKRWH